MLSGLAFKSLQLIRRTAGGTAKRSKSPFQPARICPTPLHRLRRIPTAVPANSIWGKGRYLCSRDGCRKPQGYGPIRLPSSRLWPIRRPARSACNGADPCIIGIHSDCHDLYHAIGRALRSFAHLVGEYEVKKAPALIRHPKKNTGSLGEQTRCGIMVNDQDKAGQRSGTAQNKPGNSVNDREKASEAGH